MNKIKELRIKRNVSQREIALLSGVSISSITRLEAGGKADPLTIQRLADFFGLEFLDLAEFEKIRENPGKGKPRRERPPTLTPENKPDYQDQDYKISAEELAELKADIASAEAQKLAGVLLTVEDIKQRVAEVLAEKATHKNQAIA